jgi:biopolymer transport protein ExbD
MAELSASANKGSRSSLKKMAVRVDLTAMVDLAFLLITFFILTTTLSKPKAMPLAMPVHGDPVAVGERSTMTICLGKNNQAVWYLGMADKPLSAPATVNYSKGGLRKALIETGAEVFKNTGKHLMVIIKPSDHSLYTNLVTTLDEMDITKVQSYAIADIFPQDIALLKQHNAY